MWHSSRRIALFSAGLILVGASAFAVAWLTGRLPIQFGDVESGQLAPDAMISTEPDWSGFRPAEAGDSRRDAEPSTDIFSQQAEPGSDLSPGVLPLANEGGATGSGLNRDPYLSRNASIQTQPQGSVDLREQESDGLSLPNQFPSHADEPIARTRSATRDTTADRRINLETSPHQIVRQAAFEDEVDRAEPDTGTALADRSAPMLFETDHPSTLRQARQFPSEVSFANASERESSRDNSPIQLVQATAEEPQANSTDLNAQSNAADPPPRAARNEAAVPSQTTAKTVPTLDLKRVEQQFASGDIVSVHRDLSEIYWHDPAKRPQVMEYLNRSAEIIYFNSAQHFMEPYVVQSGELLQSIAPRYQLSWPYLAMLNRTDPRRIRAGQKLKVVKGPFSVFVDLSDFELTVHHHGFFVRRYPVCVGKNNSTPTGRFQVLDKITNPQYTDPDGKVIPGGDPRNPLGTHWIDLGDSYGIHGTIEPDTIGKAESRGCLRLRNEEVVEVYNFLVKGSEVVIRE